MYYKVSKRNTTDILFVWQPLPDIGSIESKWQIGFLKLKSNTRIGIGVSIIPIYLL